MHRPLKLPDTNWRSRWLYGIPWRLKGEAMVLHRVASMHWTVDVEPDRDSSRSP